MASEENDEIALALAQVAEPDAQIMSDLWALLKKRLDHCGFRYPTVSVNEQAVPSLYWLGINIEVDQEEIYVWVRPNATTFDNVADAVNHIMCGLGAPINPHLC